MITLDDRTGSAELAPLFPPTIPVQVSRLDFADAMFLGNGPDESIVTIGIERKAVRDLLNSMVTGRLSGHQLPGLFQQYDYVYILVEGCWRYGKEGILESMVGNYWVPSTMGERRFMAKEMVAFLNTLAIKVGVQVVYSDNPQETVSLIGTLYHWWNSKSFSQHDSHLSPNKAHKGDQGQAQFTKPSLVRRVAAEIKGIGWGKSKEVAEYFPSVRRMAMASEQEWRSIQGIGKGIAQSAVAEMKKGEEDE